MKMKEKVVNVAEEMSRMIFWFHAIQQTLKEDFMPKDGKLSNLQIQSLPVGLALKYIHTDPAYYYLVEEAYWANQTIMKMCTLKYPIDKGLEWFQEKESELIAARDLINV